MTFNEPITDLNVIRNSLKNCEEITLPYKFTRDSWIKYITIKGEDEAFYEGGIFNGMGNQIIFLRDGPSRMKVPTYIKSDEGEILYKSRFFIDTNKSSECVAEGNKKKGELEKIISAQQKVIEKMSEQIKLLEESKQRTQCEIYDLSSDIQDKYQEIKGLVERERKYKLILSQYIH